MLPLGFRLYAIVVILLIIAGAGVSFGEWSVAIILGVLGLALIVLAGWVRARNQL
jgi:hypothetical protein